MKYVCNICGYVYEEEKEGVPFAELPDSWTCPWCGAAKSEFVPQELPKEAAAAAATMAETADAAAHAAAAGKAEAADTPEAAGEPADPELEKLTPAQLSALCSNLARGCEKQYKNEEAALFTRLAEYYRKITLEQPDAKAEEMMRLLQGDLTAGYPATKAAAEKDGDRGAQRVCVWGEKVTRILNSLLQRYEKEGEAFLADTEIWVCTTCGFVFVGKNPPALCPVCKVPDWKFEKTERGSLA